MAPARRPACGGAACVGALGSGGGLRNRGGEDRWPRRLLAVFLNSLDPGISPSSPLPPELPPAVVGRIRALPHGATMTPAAAARAKNPAGRSGHESSRRDHRNSAPENSSPAASSRSSSGRGDATVPKLTYATERAGWASTAIAAPCGRGPVQDMGDDGR